LHGHVADRHVLQSSGVLKQTVVLVACRVPDPGPRSSLLEMPPPCCRAGWGRGWARGGGAAATGMFDWDVGAVRGSRQDRRTSSASLWWISLLAMVRMPYAKKMPPPPHPCPGPAHPCPADRRRRHGLAMGAARCDAGCGAGRAGGEPCWLCCGGPRYR
jgi:hypothetical protein